MTPSRRAGRRRQVKHMRGEERMNRVNANKRPENAWGTLWRLMGYFRHCRSMFIAALLSVLVYSCATVYASYLMKPFVNLLGDGSRLGIHIQYLEQKVQRGIADAFIIGADFIGDDSVCLALGDNIFYGPAFRRKLRTAIRNKEGATIFGYYVADPRAFGVVEFDSLGKAISIEEKPTHPKSNYIVPGLYFYDNHVVEIARQVKPSARGELEITSINNAYLTYGMLNVVTLGDEYTWFDTGNADSLYEAAGAIRAAQRSGKMIGCLEETALRNGWITLEQMMEIASEMEKTRYGQYLMGIAGDLD